MKESRQEHRRERLRRNLSALKGSKESPINGEQNRTAHKRNRKAMRKSSKGRSPRGSSPSGRETKKACRHYLEENCTNRQCHYWHFPACRNYNTELGCEFGEMCSFMHREVDSPPDRRPEKNGGNGSVALLENPGN